MIHVPEHVELKPIAKLLVTIRIAIVHRDLLEIHLYPVNL